MIDLEIPGYQINAIRAEHRLGTVYDAVQVAEARVIELLILHASLRQVPGLEQRFLDAARDAMSLSREFRGIVVPADAGSYDDALYLARAATDGDGLDDYLARLQNRKAHVPLDTLRKALLAIALRLGALHERGIVHGNLTAAALNATRDAGLLLTDLGLPSLNAKEATRLPEGATPILPYMSPEQMLGRGANVATDIFAFGVVAYYLATGRLPRPVSLWKHGPKAYWAHTPDLAHDLRSEIEPRLSAIIHKALNTRPQHRFGNAAELADALQAVILDLSRGASAPASRQASPAATQVADVSGEQQDAALAVVEMEPQSIRQGQSVFLTLRNRGNEPLSLAVRGEDPGDSLRFGGELEELALGAGATEPIALQVSARQQPLVGRVHTFPFFVTIASQDGMREKIEGDVTVAPVVPAWLAAVLLFCLLALCAGGAVWLWPQFAFVPATVTEETAQSTVAVVAATASATATATESATANSTATVTATSTVAATTTATATATASATSAAAVLETPEPPSLPVEEIAIQLQVGERNDVWVVTPADGEARRLVPNAAQPAWSPDGRRLAFTRATSDGESQSDALFVTTASGAGSRLLTEEGMQIGGLTWSPDGSQIAYHAAPADAAGSSEYQIFVAGIDGSGVRQLTTGIDGYANMWPLWSPQGTGILAYGVPQSGAGGAQLRLYDDENQNMNVLFTEDEMRPIGGDYDWSPSGDQVAFSLSSESGDSQLFVLDVNAPIPAPITSSLVAVGSPKWAPSGERIAFVAGDGDEQEAAAIVSPGGNSEETVVSAWALEEIFWSPSGDLLGVAGDFDGDGVIQLWIIAIPGAEPVVLIEDLSDLASPEANGTARTIVAAAWRPQTP